MNKIQEEEHKNRILFGERISVTNGKTLEHDILYHIEDRKDMLYYNGTIREMRDIFPLIIPVIKYEKGFSKKMNVVSHEYMLTGCKLIMVAGKKPRLYKVNGGISAYSHEEIKYDVINRADFFQNQEMADGIETAKNIEKTMGHKIKELGKVYC